MTPTVAPTATAPTTAILPTATPSPPPPTPSPTPEPSPARYLEWFNAPRDTHQAAAAWYIQIIWDEDAELGAIVAQLPWVDDQINSEEERMLLEEIAPLSIQNLELTRQILEHP